MAKHSVRGRELRGCGDRDLQPRLGPEQHQGVRDVVPGADVGELESGDVAEALAQGQEVRERLAGVVGLGLGE